MPAAAPDRLGAVRISVFASLPECEAAWHTAMEHCAGFVFQCFEWQAAWQSTIGAAEKVVPCIVLCSDPIGQPLLLLPLGIYRYRGLRVLRFLGGVVSDYNTPLLAPGFAAQLDAAAVAKLWARIIGLLPKVDLVWLWRMPEAIDGVPNPLILLPGIEHREDAFAAFLPDTIAEFRSSHGVDWADTRRRRRRLGEAGQVEFDLPQSPAAKLEVLRTLAELKSLQWRRMRSRDLFAEPGYLHFYEKLTTAGFADGGVHVSCLRVGGRIVAAHWGFVFRDRFYNLVPAYDVAWGRYAVGRLLIEHLVEWCLAEKRIRVFDLTVGAEPYKREWTDHVLPLHELVTAHSPKGALFVAARHLRDRLKRHRRLRNFIRRVKGRPEI